MMPQPKYLFVYGTLMNGMEASDLLLKQGARLLGRAAIPGRLYDLGEYPAARPAENAGETILGELYELKRPEKITQIDEYEDYQPGDPNSLFTREEIQATPE